MDTDNASQPAAHTALEQQLRRLQHENQALQQEIEALRLEKKQTYDAAQVLEPSPDHPLHPLHKVAQLTNPSSPVQPHSHVDRGQMDLRNSSMLIVGAGGLGASSALYLGASGVGRLGIVDHDTVDISNLHRQVIHNEARQGMSKAESAALSVHLLNPHCEVIVHNLVLESSNAQPIIDAYDIVIDATDNVASRYLLNDACVLGRKPLVSGSALRLDGQLTVYNYNGGPCYRCLFPTPPPSETDPPTMTLFSANTSTMFRTIKLRKRKSECIVCGDAPTITKLIDYVRFCGSSATDKTPDLFLIPLQERLTCDTYKKIREEQRPHLLLDVREKVQFDICSLPSSLNIPLKALPDEIEKVKTHLGNNTDQPVYVVCRRGNDSQPAVRILQEHGITTGEIRDLVGGLDRWADRIDPDFPKY
ncbi:hypothetical protein BGZ72_007323 [Mortierella alpina]|nr:hypothetical protein BGZ72_007323 [Mortierella alpina]